MDQGKTHMFFPMRCPVCQLHWEASLFCGPSRLCPKVACVLQAQGTPTEPFVLPLQVVSLPILPLLFRKMESLVVFPCAMIFLLCKLIHLYACSPVYPISFAAILQEVEGQ